MADQAKTLTSEENLTTSKTAEQREKAHNTANGRWFISSSDTATTGWALKDDPKGQPLHLGAIQNGAFFVPDNPDLTTGYVRKGDYPGRPIQD